MFARELNKLAHQIERDTPALMLLDDDGEWHDDEPAKPRTRWGVCETCGCMITRRRDVDDHLRAHGGVVDAMPNLRFA